MEQLSYMLYLNYCLLFLIVTYSSCWFSYHSIEGWIWQYITSVQFISVQFSCSVMSDSLWPHEWGMPGLPVQHQLPETTQTHVHGVGDDIQPSHPLSSPSPPALNLSQHQGLFKWVSSSHQVAKVLEFQLQHQNFQWTSRTDNFCYIELINIFPEDYFHVYLIYSHISVFKIFFKLLILKT